MKCILIHQSAQRGTVDVHCDKYCNIHEAFNNTNDDWYHFWRIALSRRNNQIVSVFKFNTMRRARKCAYVRVINPPICWLQEEDRPARVNYDNYDSARSDSILIARTWSTVEHNSQSQHLCCGSISASCLEKFQTRGIYLWMIILVTDKRGGKAGLVRGSITSLAAAPWERISSFWATLKIEWS